MPDCDIAVVGAGIIGEAVAYELVTRGASVILIDARGAGLGSTQAAAGMLVPFLEGFGGPLLPLARRSLDMYDTFIERVTRDAGVGVGYRRGGSLQVATSDEHADELRQLADELRRQGVDCELLDARAVREAEPLLSEDVSCGCLVKSHGFVVTSDLSGALTAAGIKRGMRVRVPARVRRIHSRSGDVEIALEHDEPLVASQVVVAAGSWSGQIVIDGAPPLPVRPVRGQLLQLAWDGPPLQRIVWGPRCYLVPSTPGTILVGATVEEAGFDERTTVAGVRDLLDAACDLVPALWHATFAGARVGLRPATSDGMPIIGRSAKRGVVYATGHFRNGVLLAPLTARAVADLVLDNKKEPLMDAAAPERLGEY